MKKLLTTVLAGTMMMTLVFPAIAGGPHKGGHNGGSPNRGYYGGSHGGSSNHGYYGGHGDSHHGGHSDWATAGYIMSGVLIGGILQSAYNAEPPRREVVYAQPVYTQPAYPPPPVYVQRQAVVYSQPVYQTAPVQYDVQPQPVARQNSSVTLWVQNSNGSQTPVALRRADNGQFIGPKGEYYNGYPTNEQLRQLYGM